MLKRKNRFHIIKVRFKRRLVTIRHDFFFVSENNRKLVTNSQGNSSAERIFNKNVSYLINFMPLLRQKNKKKAEYRTFVINQRTIHISKANSNLVYGSYTTIRGIIVLEI